MADPNDDPYKVRDFAPLRSPVTNGWYDKIFYQGQTGRLGYPVFFGFLGTVGTLFRNYWIGIPPFVRWHRHLAVIGGMYWLGGAYDAMLTSHFADRDASRKHYMSLHPEDFVEEPAPKLKYVLYPWVPVRESWDGLKGYPLR